MADRPRRGTRQSQSWASGRRMFWGGLVAVVIVAVVVGVALSGDGGADSEGIETGRVQITGGALPMFQGTPDGGAGLNAPAISTETTLGAAAMIDPADGTARVIGFVAHWCQHCQSEVPRITAWLSENELPDGVALVLISMSVDPGRPNYPPSAWLRREGWTGAILVDSGNSDIARAYGLSGFPFWVVVSGDGRVLERRDGELSEQQFSEMIARAAQP